MTWKNFGKGNIENDLRRDGVDHFVVQVDESEPSTSRKDKRRSSQMEKFYWASFLDGTQRVLLFTKNAEVAGNTQGSDRLEKVGLT